MLRSAAIVALFVTFMPACSKPDWNAWPTATFVWSSTISRENSRGLPVSVSYCFTSFLASSRLYCG